MKELLFKNDVENTDERIALITKAVVLQESLSPEEQEQSKVEFIKYRDVSQFKGEPIIPWYLWMIGRVEVKLK